MPEFNFASLSDFWAMGGYGFFVWLSFGGSIAALLALYGYSKVQYRHFVRDLAKKQAREARVRQQQQREQS